MRSYTAHLRPGREPLLVREGWTWLGFLFGPLWLLLTGAWIPALLVLAADILFVAFATGPLLLLLLGALAFLLGLLGRDLRRWSLARARHPVAHVIVARTELEALRRLYDARPDLVEASR